MKVKKLLILDGFFLGESFINYDSSLDKEAAIEDALRYFNLITESQA